MKIVAKVAKVLLWILGVLVVLLACLPLWIGPVVKTVANAVVPKQTGTEFNLGRFALNPYTGHLGTGDIQLHNPVGFSQRMAFTLDSLSVDVDMSSVLSDVIVIRDISVNGVFVSYLSDDKGRNNFAVISGKTEGKDGKSGKKVVIDRLHIEKVLVQWGPITMPIPISITLTGIGRNSAGATLDEVWTQVCEAVTKSMGIAGKGIDSVTNAVKSVDLKGAADSLKGSADSLKSAAGSVGDAAKKLGNGGLDAADGAVKAIKGLFN